jgi:hypothetical protein
MSTYNNVLGNFISDSHELSDHDDDDYEDSASEPEPEMGINLNSNMSSQPNGLDEGNQFVESIRSKSKKTHTQIQNQGFF